MIEINYCGSCGDYSIIEKIVERLISTGVSRDEIKLVECGSCEMKVKTDGETVFREDREALDINRVVENVRLGLEA